MHTDWINIFKSYIPKTNCHCKISYQKSQRGMMVFLVIGCIAAFGLTTKVESKSSIYSSFNPISYKIQQIEDNVKLLEFKNAIIESEILILNHNLTQLFKNKEKREILSLSKLTGTHEKIGSGIILKLSDSEKPLKPGENPNTGIIHNTDLLSLVNNLWQGGAEAISINNQRISALTEITCIGPTILVNKTRTSPPFEIKAIGDSEKLIQSLLNGHVETLEMYGIKYFIEKKERIEIPADGTIILSGDF